MYHGLQTQVVSRFGRGSQFQASYTFAKLMSDIPLDDSSNGNNAGNTTDIGNFGLDRGPSILSRKHVFNASVVLNLPALENKSSVVKNLFGDWQVTTVAMASSGAPLTVTIGSIPEIPGGPAGTGFGANQRPNLVAGESCRASGGSETQWLNPHAFTLDGYALGSFGNAGRGICDGPGLFQMDFAMYKTFKLSAKLKAQVRFEVFNVTNHTNFLSVTTTMDPSVTLDKADVTKATKITGFELPDSFGQATGARDPRQAQVGLKLIF
jgi:hypothetical protein